MLLATDWLLHRQSLHRKKAAALPLPQETADQITTEGTTGSSTGRLQRRQAAREAGPAWMWRGHGGDTTRAHVGFIERDLPQKVCHGGNCFCGGLWLISRPPAVRN